MKTCTKCGETKSVSEFKKYGGKRAGLRSQCRACMNHAHAIWYSANSEKCRLSGAKWAAANKDKEKASDAKYRAANPEKFRAAVAKWAAENHESLRIKSQNRRAMKHAAGGKLSKGLADKLFHLQRGKCACGCKQPLGTNYHLDHIMPLALGGSNTDDNIQLLTATCNTSKGAKNPVEFMQSRGFLI